MKIDSPKIHSAFIIASAIVFFPVAIVLILVRFAAHAKVNHLRAKDYRAVGHGFVSFLAMISFIVLLAGRSSDQPMAYGEIALVVVVMAIVLGSPAVVFYVIASSRDKKMKALYERYYHLTTVQAVHTLNGLAQLTGESETNVRQDISYMIASGRLPDARLNVANGTIEMGHRQAATEPGQASEQAAAASEQTQAVTCFGCGSSSRIVPGVRQECEFCGNVLLA